MKLEDLVKTTIRDKKRVGRGYGSGKGGHTSGKGSKGERAHSRVRLGFLGTKNKKSFFQRLPAWRGKNKLKSVREQPQPLNLSALSVFKSGSLVDLKSLWENGLIDKGKSAKILGGGDIAVPLKIALPISSSAREKVLKAGGQVVDQRGPVEEKSVKSKKKMVGNS